MLHLTNEGAHETITIYLDQHDKPGLTLDQSGDVAVLSAREEAALPVPRDRSVVYLRRPLSDRDRVHDLPARLSAGRGAFASAHQPPGPQSRDQLLSQDPACLNEQAFIDGLV